MNHVSDIAAWMENIAPLALSESWDNTGLLLGDLNAAVLSIQTCLTLTPLSVEEAIAKQASMVIAHHPLPFKPVAKITTETVPGKMLWDLVRHGIAVYAPHTAWDSAAQGINALIAQRLELLDCHPILPYAASSPIPQVARGGLYETLGAGRIGRLSTPCNLSDIAAHLSQRIPHCRARGVDAGRTISRVAIACGSGGSLLAAAVQQECDLFLTGEATFHTCLEAEAAGVSLLMVGHYASERFAMEHMADLLSNQFPGIRTWASEQEKDPVRSL